MCHLQSSWERLTARVRHRRCACVQTHPRLKDAIARGIQEEIQLPPGTYKLIENSYTKTTKHTSAYSYPGVSAFSRSTSPNRPNLALPAGSISLRASVRGGVCVCARAQLQCSYTSHSVAVTLIDLADASDFDGKVKEQLKVGHAAIQTNPWSCAFNLLLHVLTLSGYASVVRADGVARPIYHQRGGRPRFHKQAPLGLVPSRGMERRLDENEHDIRGDRCAQTRLLAIHQPAQTDSDCLHPSSCQQEADVTTVVSQSEVVFDGEGSPITNDALGAAEAQFEVLRMLFPERRALHYHPIGGGYSAAKILHVQGVDAAGRWEEPTIVKLSPSKLLEGEFIAHGHFCKHIGHAIPQVIAGPAYIGAIGGLVLELVGACWQVPELAHTQTNLSNTFAELCKYDSVHADADKDASGIGKERRVFGEVRVVVDDVFSQLSTVVRAEATRRPDMTLLEHYKLLPRLHEELECQRSGDVGKRKYALQVMPSETLTALQQLVTNAKPSFCGPDGDAYAGLLFGIVHGDMHGGNIMVDSRSFAWMIDFGEVEQSGHVFKDPAKLEACVLFAYTAMPVPPTALQGADAEQLKWWLDIPMDVAEELVQDIAQHAGELSKSALEGLLTAKASKATGDNAKNRISDAMLRISSAAECDEFLHQAKRMVDVLVPFRDLTKYAACEALTRLASPHNADGSDSHALVLGDHVSVSVCVCVWHVLPGPFPAARQSS